MKYIIIISILFIVILICSMSSYKIESYDIPGTVINPIINPTLDVYNCYDYIIKKFPNWKFTDSQLKVLGTFRTGIDETYQIDGSEPQYTQSCVIPLEHGYLFNANKSSVLTIPSSNISHKLTLNNPIGPENPYGYVIDFSQPNQLTSIDYTNQGNFKDLLSNAYNIMDSYNLNIIHTLSNQLYFDSMTGPKGETETGLSNLNKSYIDLNDEDRRYLNTSINGYSDICMMNDPWKITPSNDLFMSVCGDGNPSNLCCPINPPCKKAVKEDIAILATQNMNNTNIDTMNAAIKYIDDNMTAIQALSVKQNAPPPPPPLPPPPIVVTKTPTSDNVKIYMKQTSPPIPDMYHYGQHVHFRNGGGGGSYWIVEHISTISLDDAKRIVTNTTQGILDKFSDAYIIQYYSSTNNNKKFEFYPDPNIMPGSEPDYIGYRQTGSPSQKDYNKDPKW